EDPPGREEVLLVAWSSLLQAQEVGEPGFDEPPFIHVGHVFEHGRMDLRPRRARLLVLENAGPPTNHLGQRPEGDALAVRKATPPVPPRIVDQTVDVLLELPREARFADPRE